MLEHVFTLRALARQPVQIFQPHLAPPALTLDLHHRVERDERHTEVGRVGCDARIAPAEHGVQAVFAVPGVAAGAGFAPVAGGIYVIKISAARALQEIAADRCCIAQLRRCARQQRLGDGRVGFGERWIMREIGIAHQRTNAHATIGERLDAIESREPRHIDEKVRAAHAAFHEIQQVGAGGEIDRARLACGRDRVGNVSRPDILEAFHATRLSLASLRLFCTSITASVIPA